MKDEVHCVACNRTSLEVPLITLTYAGQEFHICPQHMPILIHDPARLVDRLPGAERLAPAEHRD
jgi:hypothetical protein